MSQNIYDRADFFKAYTEQIDRSETQLHEDPAWSRLHPLLPDVNGLAVLDLGCGSGWFCRWAKSQGAKSVLGIDISEKMLAKARGLTEGVEDVEFRRADLDTLELSGEHDGKYDLVFSSLVLHYLVNLGPLMALVHRVLKPGAGFVFNAEHPIYTAPRNQRVLTDPDAGDKYWSFNNYHREGERISNWLAPGVRKQHRTMTGYINCFLQTGFDVAGFVEFLPTEDELQTGAVGEVEGIRPLFLMMSLRRPT